MTNLTHLACKALVVFVVSAWISSPVAALAGSSNDAVNQLAQACYAIQSPNTGKYLEKKSGIAETRYEFGTRDAENAAHFYFKPASLGEYLLTDRDGDYMGSLLPFLEVTMDKPGQNTEWDISATENDEGHHFSFRNRLTHTQIRHTYTETKSWWIFSWTVLKTETEFILEPQADCRDYPEMTLAAWPDGQPELAEDYASMEALLKGDADQPVRGYIDAHTHLTSYEFLGGKALPGDPFHRYGVEYALDSCEKEHGPGGRLDLIGDGGEAHDTTGWPDFTDWPTYNSKGHSTYYYKWIERAHLSGLRMMVVYLVENQVLCEIQSMINPASWTGNNTSCDTMESLFLQSRRVREMVDYVDAQYGGPGKGFMRIVTSPQEARNAIADGKLALLLSVEASEVLNCGERDDCDETVVETNLQALYDEGVRVMYPVHKFDNLFGGTSLQNGLVHLGQRLSTGHYFETEDCDDHVDEYDGEFVRGLVMESGIPGLSDLPLDLAGDLVGDLGPQYPEDTEQCNLLGLTDLGAFLINLMIDKKMIIDLDHLSPKAASAVMDIVEARNYSGVVSTHSWMLKAKDGPEDTNRSDDRPHATFKRLLAADGFASPMNKDSDRLIPIIESYLLALLETRNPTLTQEQLLQKLANLSPEDIPGVGIGLDMGGLATQARPLGKNPGYPFVSEFGIAFGKQGEPGKRMFDLATDGVAHYGMLADHIAQVREDCEVLGKEYVYESLMNSAEEYLNMWQRAEQNL